MSRPIMFAVTTCLLLHIFDPASNHFRITATKRRGNKLQTKKGEKNTLSVIIHYRLSLDGHQNQFACGPVNITAETRQ